jgi:hypothetical protein
MQINSSSKQTFASVKLNEQTHPPKPELARRLTPVALQDRGHDSEPKVKKERSSKIDKERSGRGLRESSTRTKEKKSEDGKDSSSSSRRNEMTGSAKSREKSRRQLTPGDSALIRRASAVSLQCYFFRFFVKFQ